MPWSAGQVVGVAIGAAMVAAGLWLIVSRRVGRADGKRAEPHAHADEGTAGRGWRAWWGRRSEPTRRVVEVCLLVAGYHVAVYSLPRGGPMLAVPRELWWVLALGIAAAVGASLWLDRRQRAE